MSSASAAIFSWLKSRKAYLLLTAIVVGLYLLPFAIVRVPTGFLYLDTDIPSHTAGVMRAACSECFERDQFFVGDLRPISERFFFWPMLVMIGMVLSMELPAVSWWTGVFFNLLGVWAMYWTLIRLTARPWFSGGLSMVLFFGVQLLAGVWFGGMIGGYNTHTLATALAAWIFGAFILTANRPDGGEKSLKFFYLSALAMNAYPLVFPHLMIVMASYLAWRKLVPLPKLMRTLLLSILLAPVAIIDFVIIHLRPGGMSLSDFRLFMPYAYLENWSFFLATGRRLVAPAILVGAMVLLRRRWTNLSGQDHPARPVLVTLAKFTCILTLVSIVAEQFSTTVLRFQFSAAMGQWLFLSLFFLVAHDVAVFRWPRFWKPLALSGAVIYLIVLSSNVFYTFRSVADSVTYAKDRRDRAAMFMAIRKLEPQDAVFLTGPNRMAIEVRGFGGRAVFVALKDQGAAQLDASKFAKWSDAYSRVKNLDFDKEIDVLKTLALERGLDYIIVGSSAELGDEDVVYSNDTYTVFRLY